MLLTVGIGNQSLTGAAFKALYLVQNLQEPSFFLTKRTGDEKGLELARTKSDSIISRTCFSISSFWKWA